MNRNCIKNRGCHTTAKRWAALYPDTLFGPMNFIYKKKRDMSAERSEKFYTYESYKENDTRVVLPEQIEGLPLTVIAAKAFLSCRTVERLELPDTLEQVEDWAFAHMKNLRELVFPPKEIEFGKKVFLGCDSLEKISLLGVKDQYEGIPFFLASMVKWMSETPVKLALAGDTQRQWEWLDTYDRALLDFLDKPDDVGFEPAFIGWFHVEDVDDQKQKYILERRKCKLRVALQRLRYPAGASQDTQRQLGAFLLGTGETQDDTRTCEPPKIPSLFLELCREESYGQDIRYFQIWHQIGGFALYSPQFLLEQLPEADPEVRGFLMKCSLSQEREDDFFEGMEL